jgi:D-alanyl-D-alanine carboxypeptidase
MQPGAAELLQRALVRVSEDPTASSAPPLNAVALALCVDGRLEQAGNAEGLFPAYSITKSFIAALLLGLCDGEVLELDGTLERWLPELPEADRISLRRLLNHSAGVPDYGGLPAYHAAVQATPRTPWSGDEFEQHTFAKGLAYPPGEGWAYSNPGYMLAVRVAERASGESFDALLSERILAPLGLSDTSSPRELHHLAPLVPATSVHLHPKGEPRAVRENYHPGWVAHRFVISRPAEIVQFYEALFTGRLIEERWIAEMKRLVPVPRPHPRISQPAYGLGLMSNLDREQPAGFGHNGGGPGYSASAFHFPALAGKRVTLCAMAVNDYGELAEHILLEVRSLLEQTS